MEPKEQQPKHTAEPWILHNDNQHDQTHKSGWFCGDDKPFGYLLSEEDFNHAAKCVNALEGIEDPEKYMHDLKVVGVRTLMLEHAEYEKYKTACEQINKDNPMAVTENISDMKTMLEFLEPKIRADGNAGYADMIKQLLTKIQQA